jgi:hypothetical protein
MDIPRMSVMFDEGGYVWDSPERWNTIWTVERMVAEAYGITPWQFEDFVLPNFPGFARKRPAFFAFLQGEVNKWKAGS